ncbi:MAG: NAD(P)-binding protein, partial [Methanomassiliicoccales archaeon]
RALLADPSFPHAILEGKPFRSCIRCNQACRDNNYGEVRCTVNPLTGLESRGSKFSQLKGEICIAGAGIKGLEAAATAASMGLKAILYEASEQIGGQLNEYSDTYKLNAFRPVLEYYGAVLKHFGADLRTGEKCDGAALYCMPDVIYPHLVPRDVVTIDSNVFQYHDEALRLSSECNIIMTERSLNSLDRTRQIEFRKLAEKNGIKFVKIPEGKCDVKLYVKRQYDIRAAMVSGRNSLVSYLEAHLSEFQ